MHETAYKLIDRSIGYDCIAHGEYGETVADDLAEACDDSVDTGDTVEYWGTRDGEKWRVHLDRNAADE